MRARLLVLLAVFLAAPSVFGQEPAAPTPTPSEAPPPAARRPPEGDHIVVLPTVQIGRPGTLTLLFTHRWEEPVNDSDIHNLYSLDDGANIGIGFAYVPIERLEVALFRSSEIDVYELSARWRALELGPFAAALRAGVDWRTETGAIFDVVPEFSDSGVFVQVPLSVAFGPVQFTVVPTWVSETSAAPFVKPEPFYEDLFNVPAGISVGLGKGWNAHGEVYPGISDADSPFTGWIASIEKTVLRHRFSVTCGNMRSTTVDQYVAPGFSGTGRAQDLYLGFNLVRSWNLK
jgi:hypothetical protein